MKTYDPSVLRSVALELQSKMSALYADILPIQTETAAWTLDSLNTLLPTPFAVRVQLAAYRALRIEALRLTDWIGLVLGAEVGDTIGLGATGIESQTGMSMVYWGDLPVEGWLELNGQTIGNADSGATARANADTEDLFVNLWGKHPNTDLPIQDSTGAATTRGLAALDDFNANKRLPLPNLTDQIDLYPVPGLGSVTATVIIKL